MSQSAELEALLAEVAKARSPAAKLAVAARLANRIRGLSRKEQLEIGKQMGTGWLARRFEQLFDDGRVVSDLEQTALATASEIESMSVDEITELARDLRSGRADSLGDRVRAVLARAGAVPLEEDEPPEIEEDSDDGVEAEAEPEPTHVAPPAPPAPPAPLTASALADDLAESAPTGAPPLHARSLSFGPQAALSPPPEPEEALETAFAEPFEVNEDASTFEILRALEQHPARLRALGREGRAALVERLVETWALRRAIAALARAEAIESLDEACALLERLPSDRDRSWCLDELMDHLADGDEDVQRLLATIHEPQARSRIEKRLHV